MHTVPPAHGRERKFLVVIGCLKLGKAAILILVGIGLGNLLKGDRIDELQGWLDQFKPDIVTRSLHEGLEKLLALPPRWRSVIHIGTFAYAALFATEGFGLIAGKRWAEWLTVFATATLVPFEAFEIYRKFTVLRVIILLANLAILAYLIWQIRADKKSPADQGRAVAPTRPEPE